MTTWGEVREWKADAVGDAGEQLRADLDKLERAADEVRAQAVPGSWTGIAAILAQGKRDVLVETMDTHVSTAMGFVRALYQAEGRVRGISELVVGIEHDAKAQEFEISSDGTVTDVAEPPVVDSPRVAESYRAERTAVRDALVDRIESVLTTAYDVDSSLVHARPDDAFNDAGPTGVVDPEVARDWAAMSDDDRRAVLEQLARELAEEYGIEDIEFVIEDLEDEDGDGTDDDPHTNSHGFWRDSEKSLHLDVNDLDDPELLDTVAHEVRHGVQNQAVDNLDDEDFTPPVDATREEVESWEENFDDYQTVEDDGFDAYEGQPVEVDAREAGDGFLDDLTAEELERLREEAG